MLMDEGRRRDGRKSWGRDRKMGVREDSSVC
jgi:hypothetical protein